MNTHTLYAGIAMLAAVAMLCIAARVLYGLTHGRTWHRHQMRRN